MKRKDLAYALAMVAATVAILFVNDVVVVQRLERYFDTHPGAIARALEIQAAKSQSEHGRAISQKMRSNWPQIADTEAFIVQYDGRNMLSRLAKIADIPQIKSVPNFVFTDYRCGFCKADRTAVTNLLKNHPGENFVFIETAILGQESVDLAEDAVSDATSQPSDYYAIHYRYFDKPSSHPTNPLSAAVALVARHRELANSLGVTSTPTYVLSGIAHVGTLGETN